MYCTIVYQCNMCILYVYCYYMYLLQYIVLYVYYAYNIYSYIRSYVYITGNLVFLMTSMDICTSDLRDLD